MWWPPCNGCGRTSLHQTERNDKKLNISHPDKKLITGIFLFIEQIVPELYIILIKGKHTGEDAVAPMRVLRRDGRRSGQQKGAHFYVLFQW